MAEIQNQFHQIVYSAPPELSIIAYSVSEEDLELTVKEGTIDQCVHYLDSKVPDDLRRHIRVSDQVPEMVYWCDKCGTNDKIRRTDPEGQGSVGTYVIAMVKDKLIWYAIGVGHFLKEGDQIEVRCCCRERPISGTCLVSKQCNENSKQIRDISLSQLTVSVDDVQILEHQDKNNLNIDKRILKPNDEVIWPGRRILIHRGDGSDPLPMVIKRVHCVCDKPMGFRVNFVEFSCGQSMLAPGDCGSLVSWEDNHAAFAYVFGCKKIDQRVVFAIPLWDNIQHLFNDHPEYTSILNEGTVFYLDAV